VRFMRLRKVLVGVAAGKATKTIIASVFGD
jgi:hypothetical protein